MRRILWFLAAIILASCTPQEQTAIIVSLVADGVERVYQYSEPITVEQFLDEADVEIGNLDRINPQPWTQIFDGIRITVVRVEETNECDDVEIPYETRTQFVEGLVPGEPPRIVQQGRAGVEEICYRVTIEDGQRRERVEVNREIKDVPQDEILGVAPTDELEPVAISGTLAYINNNNAWIIRGSSRAKRVVTVSGDLDPRVFSLSPDGRQLLIARRDESDGIFSNQLYLIPDTTSENPDILALNPQDVLYAEWVPGQNNTISYSTGEATQVQPGWQALNDLWIMRIDPASGDQINIEKVPISGNGGIYGWWGRDYEWSPDGNRLAWVHADGVGLIDLETGDMGDPLMRFAELRPQSNWSWRTTVSWSPDGNLLAATVHGEPFGSEPRESSPVFNIAVAAADGSFAAELTERTGIWATPRFSPEIRLDDNPFPQGYMAYLRAREWEASITSEYDLVVADRDGSNERVIFPPEGQPGLRAQQFAQDFVWSPDGTQIALIYLGNLWTVDVETGIAYQLTQDGQSSKPVWTR
ncbi:MAG: hypothetical protein OHK0046_51410 [Anaerolineae bacterium]